MVNILKIKTYKPKSLRILFTSLKICFFFFFLIIFINQNFIQAEEKKKKETSVKRFKEITKNNIKKQKKISWFSFLGGLAFNSQYIWRGQDVGKNSQPFLGIYTSIGSSKIGIFSTAKFNFFIIDRNNRPYNLKSRDEFIFSFIFKRLFFGRIFFETRYELFLYPRVKYLTMEVSGNLRLELLVKPDIKIVYNPTPLEKSLLFDISGVYSFNFNNIQAALKFLSFESKIGIIIGYRINKQEIPLNSIYNENYINFNLPYLKSLKIKNGFKFIIIPYWAINRQAFEFVYSLNIEYIFEL